MFGARRRLRFRLALEFMLIAGAIHALVSLGVMYLREQFVRAQFDADLRGAAQVMASSIARNTAVPIPEAFAQVVGIDGLARAPGETVEVRGADGEVIATTSPDVRLPFAVESGPRVVPLSGRVLGRAGDFRQITLSGFRQGEAFFVQKAKSTAEMVDGFASLRWLLFGIVLPATMIGAGAAAWFVSRRALGRIDQVALALRQVRAGEPNPRIDVGNGPDEIGEMVSEMNAMLARLEAAFRSQERFIVNVTHELKTPVSVLLAQAQLLKGENPGVPSEYRDFVSSVEEEMRRLGALLESFLTLARSGHGQRYIESSLVSLNEVIIEAIRRVGSVASEKRVSLVPTLSDSQDEEPVLRGDLDLLTTALGNLIRDGIEQSPPGSPVGVAIEEQGGHCQVVVSHVTERDEAGHPKNYARHGRRRTRELAQEVARGIAQLHGGDVWREEADGCGRAVMRIPLNVPAVETPAEGRAEVGQSARQLGCGRKV